MMLDSLKKLFCKHIYKLEEKIPLESSLYKYKAVRVYSGSADRFGELRFVELNKYALLYKCVKCCHEKVEKHEEECPSSKKWSLIL